MNVIHFMNEVPVAFPSALVREINTFDDIEIVIASFYDDIDDEVRGSLRVTSLKASSRTDVRAYRRFRRQIINENADIIHTHPNATGSLARLTAASTEASIVDTRHNDHRHFSPIQRLPNVLAAAVTDCSISNSQNTRNSFSKIEDKLLCANGGRHKVVHNGIDPKIAENIPTKPPIQCRGPTITCVARYVEQKNHDTLVRAMGKVKEKIPEANLILVGDGERYEYISQMIRKQGLEDSIIQTGYLHCRRDVLATVEHSDIFAVPSCYEGFCIAAVEAMLLGVPVVASDIDVLREVVDGAGMFAPPDNADAFADRIIELLQDEERRASLASTGISRAKNKFPLSRTAEGYVQVYRELCGC